MECYGVSRVPLPYYHILLTCRPSHSPQLCLVSKPTALRMGGQQEKPVGDVATSLGAAAATVAASQAPGPPPPPLTCKSQALTNDDAGEMVGRHAHELALKRLAEVRMQGGRGSRPL